MGGRSQGLHRGDQARRQQCAGLLQPRQCLRPARPVRPCHRRLHPGHQARPHRSRFLQQPRPDLRQPGASTTLPSPTTRRRSASTAPAPGPSTIAGLSYANKGDYQRAIADFDQAIKLAPGRSRSLRGPRCGERGAGQPMPPPAPTTARRWRSMPDNEDAMEGLSRLGGCGAPQSSSAPSPAGNRKKTTAGALAPAAEFRVRWRNRCVPPIDPYFTLRRAAALSCCPSTCMVPQRPGPLLLAFLPFLALAFLGRGLLRLGLGLDRVGQVLGPRLRAGAHGDAA